MGKPLVDITTINAVQSIFRGSVRDPWAQALAGELADLFIYGDTIRYPLPVPDEPTLTAELFAEPSLLHDLTRRDPATMLPEAYPTSEPLTVREEYLGLCFERFLIWCRANPRRLGTWIQLHNEPWIRPVQGGRAQHRYVFDLNRLIGRPQGLRLAQQLGCTEDDVFYAFDVVLRFALYGQIAGEGERYLNHPIREAFMLPTMHWDVAAVLPPPVSFRSTIADLAPRLSQDEYSALLHELRGSVREMGVHHLQPGNVEPEVVRDLAARVALPPRLRQSGKVAGIISGIATGLGTFPALGPASAFVGAVIAVSAACWKGKLPRQVAKWNWVRWALKWDIEEEASDRQGSVS